MTSTPKILTVILIQLICIFSSNAQQCTNDSLTLYPSGDVSYSQSGFIDPNILPCIPSSSYSELLIPFKTYNQGARLLTLVDSSTIPVAHIYGIKVESISNLPAGLCWTTTSATNSITGDQVGVIIIKGTTSATAGTYPLAVGLSLDIQGSGSYTYTGFLPANYQTLLGQVVLRIMGTDNICPTVTY